MEVVRATIICMSLGSRSKSTKYMSWWSSRSSIGLCWSYTIGKGPYKSIIENQEIGKVGLSETHASGNREGLMKSQLMEQVPARKIKTDMEWWSLRIYRFFQGFVHMWRRLQCVRQVGCTYIHLLHAHFFCAQRAHCVLRTSSCVLHARMAQGCQKVRCMSSFSISPFPFLCVTRLCCSCTSTSTSRSCPYFCPTFPS